MQSPWGTVWLTVQPNLQGYAQVLSVYIYIKCEGSAVINAGGATYAILWAFRFYQSLVVLCRLPFWSLNTASWATFWNMSDALAVYRASLIIISTLSCADPEGGGGQGSGPPSPWKITKIGFLSKTYPDPLKNHKAAKPTFKNGPSLAHQRNAI